MAREFSRSRRVAEQIQRELAVLIQQEVRDPRLGLITVSGVEVTRDLAHAKVYVTLLGEGDIEQSLTILRKASGFLRRELGRRMLMRQVPELRFLHDTSIETGFRMDELIREAVEKDKQTSED